MEALPKKDFGLAIQRQVGGILRNQHMRQQARTGEAAFDRPARRRFLHDASAAGAAQFWPHNLDDFESRRNVLEDLGNIFGQQPQRTAAVGAGLLPRLAALLFPAPNLPPRAAGSASPDRLSPP